MEILGIAYLVAGWWAWNKIWYSKHVYIVSNPVSFYIGKFLLCAAFGWVAIPIAIIMRLLKK